MSRRPQWALRRRTLLAGAVLGLAALLAVIALAEALRPGHPAVSVLDEPSGDPRDLAECPETEVREGAADETEPMLSPTAPPIDVSSNRLLDCPDSYDGRVVRYQGEVVGGLLRRDGGAWTQLNDDAYAEPVGRPPAHRSYRGGNAGVGVFLPDDVADRIATVGGPHDQGDLVEVVGTFGRVDPETHEVAVIRVDSAEIVRAGQPVEADALREQDVAAALLALLAVGTVVTERRVARRRDRE